jgi:hypothetical protein
VLKEFKVLLEELVELGQQVLKVLKEHKVVKEHKVLKVLKDSRAREFKVLKVLKVHQEHLFQL